jgi:hypothetical protein
MWWRPGAFEGILQFLPNLKIFVPIFNIFAIAKIKLKLECGYFEKENRLAKFKNLLAELHRKYTAPPLGCYLHFRKFSVKITEALCNRKT